MAKILGTLTAQRQASKDPAVKPEGQLIAGTIVSFEGQYVCTGAEVTEDQFDIILLPIGAILLVDELKVTSEGVGGTTVIINKLGDAGDDDRYSSGNVAITAAGVNLAFVETNANALDRFKVDTEANQAIVTSVEHAGAPVAGKKVTFRGKYRMP